jgi:hypothetical protein
MDLLGKSFRNIKNLDMPALLKLLKYKNFLNNIYSINNLFTQVST